MGKLKLVLILIAILTATLLLGGCVAGDRLVEKVYISDEDIEGDVNIGALGDAFTLTLNGLPIVGGVVSSQWTNSVNGIEYTAGNVGIGLNAEANSLLSLYDNAGGLASQTVLNVAENSGSAGATGINVSVMGAKTSTTYGEYISNAATSNTAGINKYGLYLRSTSVWNGAGSINYGLYIEEPTGGTTNWALYSAGGVNYLNGATIINAALDMNTHQINNVVDPTLAQDVATKNYVDSGLGGIYVPYNGATGNVDLNAKNLTNINILGASTINAFTMGGNITGSSSYTLDNLGHVGIGDNSTTTDNLYVKEVVTLTDNTNQRGIKISKYGAKTTSNYSGTILGLSADAIIDATNTKDWTSAQGLVGVNANTNIDTGAVGTVTGITGFRTGAVLNGGAVAIRQGYYVTDASGTATLTDQFGFYVPALTKATTNNYAFYAVSNPSYLGGAVALGDTLTVTNGTSIGGSLNMGYGGTNHEIINVDYIAINGHYPYDAPASQAQSLVWNNVLDDPTSAYISGICGKTFISSTIADYAGAIAAIKGDIEVSATNTKNITQYMHGVNEEVFLRQPSAGSYSVAQVALFTGRLTVETNVTVPVSYCFYAANPIKTGVITTHTALYIENPTSGTTNYSIYSAGGLNYLAGTMQLVGNMGIGTTVSNTIALNLLSAKTLTDNTTYYGSNYLMGGAKTSAVYTGQIVALSNNAVATAANTQNWTNALGLVGVNSQVTLQTGLTGTVTGAASFRAVGVVQAGALNLYYGLLVSNPSVTGTGSLGFSYGIRISDLTSAGTNYSIYSGSAPSYFAGNIGIGQTTASAYLHIKAGTTTAGTAPLKLTSGTLLGTPEVGAIEFLADDYYATITTGTARKGLILNDGTNLTSGRVPIATTNGRLTDDADLTFLTDTLTATKGNIGFPYGSFSDSTTQTITGATTSAYVITFNTDEYKSQITHSTSTNPSRVTIDVAGTYLITFSAIGKSTVANKTLDIWLAVDGSNVPRSDTLSRFVGAGNERIITVTLLYTFTAGQYFELYWSSDDAGTTLQATAAGASPTRPASPSIILTVNKVSK
jgi:hypothetical protein